MLVDMETRLGMRLATFVPAEDALEYSFPYVSGGIEPTVQAFVGGVTDRNSRAASDDHPKRGVVLVEAPYPDLMALPQDLWSSSSRAPVHEWVLEQIRPGDRPSPEDAGGLCISSMEVDPSIEDEFNEWYNEEHMPLLDPVPGVIAARRFRAISGLPRYVALYHLESPDVYKQRRWAEANQTPWIRRIHRFRLRTLHMILERVALPD